MAGKTTIPAGSQIQFPVSAGTTVTLSGLGQVQFVQGTPGSGSTPQPVRTFTQASPAIVQAPLAGNMIVSADSLGSGVTYDLTSATDLMASNANGVRQVVARIPAGMTSAPLAPIIVHGNTSICGDSLVAFGDVAGALTQTAAGVLAATGGKTACSVLAWVDAHLKSGRIDLVSNRGVGSTLIDGTATNSVLGTNTPQFGNGSGAGVLTDASRLLWIHSGVNHLSTTNDPSAPTATAIAQKFRRMIGIAASRKPAVVVEGIYPIGLGSGATHYARRFDIPLINAQVAAFCAQFPNVVYLDPSILSIDGGATGDPKYYLASDGLHLNGYGAFTLGKDYAQQLEGRVWIIPGYRPVKTVLMPEMAGTSGGKTPNTGVINGTVPGNMRAINLAGSPTVTLVTQNNRLYATIDNSAQASSATFTVDLNSRTAYIGNLALNDVITASATLNVTNPVGLRAHDMYLSQNFDDGVGATRIDVSAMAQSNQELINGNSAQLPPHSYGQITLRTQPFTIASALTNLNVRFTFIVAAFGSVTVDIGDLTVDAVVAA
jgi:hypothetical protein